MASYIYIANLVETTIKKLRNGGNVGNGHFDFVSKILT